MLWRLQSDQVTNCCSNFLWFQWMPLRNIFLIKVFRFLATYILIVNANTFSISVMQTDDFWFYVTDDLRHLSHAHELRNLSTQVIENAFEKKFVKRKSNLNFIRTIRNSPFNPNFVYSIYMVQKFFLLTMSCSLVSTSPC